MWHEMLPKWHSCNLDPGLQTKSEIILAALYQCGVLHEHRET